MTQKQLLVAVMLIVLFSISTIANAQLSPNCVQLINGAFEFVQQILQTSEDHLGDIFELITRSLTSLTRVPAPGSLVLVQPSMGDTLALSRTGSAKPVEGLLVGPVGWARGDSVGSDGRIDFKTLIAVLLNNPGQLPINLFGMCPSYVNDTELEKCLDHINNVVNFLVQIPKKLHENPVDADTRQKLITFLAHNYKPLRDHCKLPLP